MRTTVRLDPELIRAIRDAAARRGATVTALVDEALRAHLARARPAVRRGIRLPISRGGRGVLPGVNLNNNAALLDLMEGSSGSRRR